MLEGVRRSGMQPGRRAVSSQLELPRGRGSLKRRSAAEWLSAALPDRRSRCRLDVPVLSVCPQNMCIWPS